MCERREPRFQVARDSERFYCVHDTASGWDGAPCVFYSRSYWAAIREANRLNRRDGGAI